MTWGEFKKWMEEKGVTDEDKIRYMDFYFPETVERTEDGLEVY